MTMMPGTPSALNVMPSKYLGTTTMAPLLGMIGSVVLVIFNVWYMRQQLRHAKANGKGYHVTESKVTVQVIADKPLPSVWLSLLPSAVLVIALNALKIDLIWSLVAACITASVVFWRNMVPGILVDHIVIGRPENHMQTMGDLLAQNYRPPCSHGAGAGRHRQSRLLERVAAVAAEEKVDHLMSLTLETGLIGGIPASGLDFGHAVNVNVSKFNGRPMGCGGFINITQNAKNVVYCCAFTAGGLEIDTAGGQLRIVQEGKSHKFIVQVEQITFSGEYASALYVTERAVFQLTDEGMELIEIAPGIDLGMDILAHMDFWPIRRDVKIMNRGIFQSTWGGLAELLAK